MIRLNLHKAVQVLHRHSEYSKKDWDDALKEIMASGLSRFYKNYYERLYQRVINGEVLA